MGGSATPICSGVVVHADVQFVLEHRQVEARAGLLGGFPAGGIIGNRVEVGSLEQLVEVLAEDDRVLVVQELDGGDVVRIEVDITDAAPACAELDQVENLVEACIPEEFFGREFPRSRYRGEPVVVLARRQLRRGVAAHAAHQEIAVVERITQAGQERHHGLFVFALLGRVRSPVIGLIPNRTVDIVVGIPSRIDFPAVQPLEIGREARHRADVVPAEYLCIGRDRLREPVVVPVEELFAVVDVAPQAFLRHGGVELVGLFVAQVDGEVGLDRQRRDRLDFDRGRREDLMLGVFAVHPFEVCYRVVEHRRAVHVRPLGARTAVIAVALLVAGVCPVLVHLVDRSRARVPYGTHDRALVAGVHVALPVGYHERRTLRNLEPVGEFEVGLQFAVETLAVGVEQHAVLLVVGYREDGLYLLAAARDRCGVVLRETGLKNLIQPVGAGYVAPGVYLRVGGAGKLAAGVLLHGFCPHFVVLFRREHLRQVGHLLEAERDIHVYAEFAALGLLRRDEDDAARTYRCAVDCSRGGILEHGDRLDVLHHVGGVGHAVHDDKYAVARGRVVVVAFRSAAADGERGGFHRVAGLLYGDARHTALEDGRQVRGAAFGRFVELDGRHGHREVFLALRTVTDGYDFADHRGILLQRDVDHGAVQDCDALGFVADEREAEGRVAAYGDLVVTFRIGRNAVGRPLFYDRSADERCVAGVGQTPCNRDAVLRLGRMNE